MNTIEDVQKLVINYYFQTGVQMQQVESLDKVVEGAKQAELRFTEGLKQLEQLKLSPADRRNLKLLREAFYLIIRSMREISKGNHFKASKYGSQSADKAFRYAQMKGFKIGDLNG